MKKSLSTKDIKRISDKQRKETVKREKFESFIDVYSVVESQYPTYALVRGWWPKLSSKKSRKYYITYYLFNPDMVTKIEGSALSTYSGEKFKSYKEFNKFKIKKLRELNEFEIEVLKGSNIFKGHFQITDVESIEMTQEQFNNLDEIFKNSRN